MNVGDYDTKVELHFLGATLQLRGISPVDTVGNILVYNDAITYLENAIHAQHGFF